MTWLTPYINRIKLFLDKDASQYLEPPGVGIAWIWKLPDSHPFFEAAKRHDYEYDLMLDRETLYKSSYFPDLNFYKACIAACSAQPNFIQIEYYLAQAKLFYGLISTWGLVRWKS